MWWNLHLPLHWGTWNNYIYILRTTQRTNTGQVLRIGGSWGILSIVKSLQKQLQKRHKHRCLKIDNTSPKIDIFFERTVLSLLPPTGNNAQVWFLIHQVLTTSATVLRIGKCLHMRFFLRVRKSEYTCHPINYYSMSLLYCIEHLANACFSPPSIP